MKRSKGMRIRLPAIFSDGMMLQGKRPVKVWGTAAPGAEVQADIQGRAVKVRAGEDGHFSLTLPPLSYGEGEMLTISCEGEEVTIHDVAVGEVFLAGGQSNMEFWLRYEAHFDEEKTLPRDSSLRFFDVPEISYDRQEEDFDFSSTGIWRKAGPGDRDWFSAVGYYFQKALSAELDCPVGIVGCNFGGTTASAWMPTESVEEVGQVWMEDYRAALKKIEDQGISVEHYWELERTNAGNDKGNPFTNDFCNTFLKHTPDAEEIAAYEAKQAAAGGENPLFSILLPEAVPGTLYEHMLKTVAPYTVRAFLYYQGESDDPHADLYAVMLSRLIEDWRALWGEDLPFLQVQLAPFSYWMQIYEMNWGELRMAQGAVSSGEKNVYITSIADCGDEDDIHPKDKKTVGERLALLALGRVYGRRALCEPPRAISADRDGREVRIRFENGDGLHLTGKEVDGLCICPEVPYTAETEGDCLLLHLSKDVGRLRLRFGWDGYFCANVKNAVGIPPLAFSLVTTS